MENKPEFFEEKFTAPGALFDHNAVVGDDLKTSNNESNLKKESIQDSNEHENKVIKLIIFYIGFIFFAFKLSFQFY